MLWDVVEVALKKKKKLLRDCAAAKAEAELRLLLEIQKTDKYSSKAIYTYAAAYYLLRNAKTIPAQPK